MSELNMRDLALRDLREAVQDYGNRCWLYGTRVAPREPPTPVTAPNMAEDLLRRFVKTDWGSTTEWTHTEDGSVVIQIVSEWVTVTPEEAAYLHSLEDQQ